MHLCANGEFNESGRPSAQDKLVYVDDMSAQCCATAARIHSVLLVITKLHYYHACMHAKVECLGPPEWIKQLGIGHS